jgi:hypothetical protein
MHVRRPTLCALSLLAALSLGALPASSQAATPASPPAAAKLTLVGEGGKRAELTTADFAKLPRQTVAGADKDAGTFEGVSLTELLRLVGAPLGDALSHHEHPTWYVVIDAQDGYHALFALAELDPAFSDRVVLLADRKNGQPLAADEGPWRLVVPGERRHARWVHKVSGLRLERAR